jgi:hypothetical protein
MTTDTTNGARRSLLLPAALLAGGLMLAALIFGAFFYNARAPQQTVRVVGSATRGFDSDIVKWRLTLSRQVGDASIREGYASLRDDVTHFRTVLRARGLPDSAVVAQPPTAQPLWGREGVRTGYTLQQPLYVISDRLADLEPLALDPVAMLRDGAALEMSQLEYFYTDIARLKHELLSEATRDARARAAQIAEASEAEVGSIISARAGVFQITEPYSTEVSGFGMHSTNTRKKEITVTMHADFLLR